MSNTITITEALQEIKTIEKRIQRKRELVAEHAARHEKLKDPFASDGGTVELLAREMQGIQDLEERRLMIRIKIQEANQAVRVSLNGTERTIAEWLVWRREIAPQRQSFLRNLSAGLAKLRKDAQTRGQTVAVGAAIQTTSDTVPDVVVNLNERDLLTEIESLDTVLGDLDGQLSLRNARETVTI